MTEKIGNVSLKLDYYEGQDLYSDGAVEEELLEAVKTHSPEEFPELIRTSPVACVLCGHTHHNHEGLLGDKACYTADGMSFYGENLQDGTVRFREKFGYSLLKLEDGIVKERLVRTFDTGRLLGKM